MECQRSNSLSPKPLHLTRCEADDSSVITGVTYTSLVDTRLTRMSGNIAKLILHSLGRYRLRNKVLLRSGLLARLDGDGRSGRRAGSLLFVLESITRLVEGHARRRGDIVSDDEVVQVHRVRLRYVLLRCLPQLRNATRGIERSSGLAMLLLLLLLCAWKDANLSVRITTPITNIRICTFPVAKGWGRDETLWASLWQLHKREKERERERQREGER